MTGLPAPDGVEPLLGGHPSGSDRSPRDTRASSGRLEAATRSPSTRTAVAAGVGPHLDDVLGERPGWRSPSPGAQSKTTYEAPRFQANRLRPDGSRTRHASSSGPSHCWPDSAGTPLLIRRASTLEAVGRQVLAVAAAGRSPTPDRLGGGRRPRRSPSPRCSGLAREDDDEREHRHHCQRPGSRPGARRPRGSRVRRARRRSPPPQAGSSGSGVAQLEPARGSSRPPRARPTRPRPACGATAERHTTPVSTNANAIVADRPDDLRHALWRDERHREEPREEPGPVDDHPRRHQGGHGARGREPARRTRPTSLQRTPTAIATAGIARTKYPVASSEAFVPTISGGAWRIQQVRRAEEEVEPDELAEAPPAAGIHRLLDHVERPGLRRRARPRALAPASTVPPSDGETRGGAAPRRAARRASVTRIVAVNGIVQGA